MPAVDLPSLARQGFVSTHWTTIRACAGNDDAAIAARAELCKAYWYPVYAYIKRQGHDPHQTAEDLTQDFFGYVLSRPWFERADGNKGRFRSYLLGTLNHFLQTELSRKTAKKREGSYQHIPYDLDSQDARQPVYQTDHSACQAAYELEWAMAVVSTALRRLEAEYSKPDRALIYEHLNRFLRSEGEASSYEEVAARLGISAANVKVSVHRLRKRYGIILREQVAATVAAFEDVEEEMCHLHTVLTVG